jgi:hypothetical protein
MSKLRLALLAVVLMSLATAFAASAAPLPFFAQQDPLEQVFLASSRAPHLPHFQTKCGAYCDTTVHGTTPTATAIGSSCTTVQSNLTSQLNSYAHSYCVTKQCNLVVTTTVACHVSGTGYSVSGYATFNCTDNNCNN